MGGHPRLVSTVLTPAASSKSATVSTTSRLWSTNSWSPARKTCSTTRVASPSKSFSPAYKDAEDNREAAAEDAREAAAEAEVKRLRDDLALVEANTQERLQELSKRLEAALKEGKGGAKKARRE